MTELQGIEREWPTCSCGCGNPVPAYKTSNRTTGAIKGEPATCLRGHSGGPDPIDWSDLLTTNTGCHIFASYKYPAQGYRRARWKGEPQPIHRMVWEKANGDIPAGHVIHHRCENKKCVNLGHLELLTDAEHTLRHKLGQPATHGRLKLRDEDIPVIRSRAASGETLQRIAEDYPVTAQWIGKIVRGLG